MVLMGQTDRTDRTDQNNTVQTDLTVPSDRTDQNNTVQTDLTVQKLQIGLVALTAQSSMDQMAQTGR